MSKKCMYLFLFEFLNNVFSILIFFSCIMNINNTKQDKIPGEVNRTCAGIL